MNFSRIFLLIAFIQNLLPASAQFSGTGGGMAPDSTKKLKIAAGTGVRYMMDLAVGKEDWGIYFRITETF